MISKPNVNVTLASATTILDIGPRRNLIICQSPNAVANELIQDVHDKSQTQLNSLFGSGSYIRVLVQTWLDANQVGSGVKAPLDVIALAEAGGAAASDTVLTFTGTSATEAGTIELSILSSELYKKSVTVAVGDDPTDIATAVAAAYAAVTAPFTVASALGVVTSSASDAGTIGNDYGMEITGVPAGITAVITAATGGTGTPTVTSVMDLVGDTTRYTGILWPSDLIASSSEVVDFLDDRFNVSNDVLDGVAFIGESDTLANLKTTVNAENSQSLVVMGNNITAGSDVKKGPEIVHPVDFVTSEFMGIRARRLTDDASIASVVTSNASGDQFGGRGTASLPYFNTPLADTPVTNSVNLFGNTDQSELNIAGYSVVGPNRAITDSIAGTVVTTYKTDPAGNADVSFKYLNYVDTASVCREFIFTNLKALFVQSRLTDGDLVAGLSMENAASIEAAFKGLLGTLKDDGLIRLGRTADTLIDNNLTVTLDLASRKATVNSVLPIVTQLETIDVALQLTFEL